ncbi:MAG: helix-turn-helix domain-containing protein [Candidatus Omnitrophota bacterium]|nr:helix-turn-helix domain-containing protein [Candidatus Omnitrophota bacterium]
MNTIDKKEWEKSEILTKAILEAENIFLHEKEGRLYDFLVDIIEKPLIENLLVKTEGNQLKAAKILGINRNTLHAKIKKLGIDVGYFKNERRIR